MKAMKKILATVMCLCVLFGCLSMTASGAAATGSITIKNPDHSEATVAGKTFNLYKIFNATTSGSNISYSWYEKDGEIPFYDFFFGPNGYVEANKTNGNVQDAVDKVSKIDGNLALSQFAEELHKYIVANNIDTFIDPVVVADGKSSVTIDSLPYGYYLVYDATDLSGDTAAVRSAVMLTNVSNGAVITLKANRPQIEKYVLENDEVTYGKGTSSSIGDTVTFKIITLAPSHTLYTTYHYSIEDTLPEGLILDQDSIKVYKGTTLLSEGSGYDLEVPAASGASFEIDFTNYMDDFTIGDELIVIYDTTATSDIKPQKANQNIATLIYSNDPTNDTSTGSVSDYANVYSYQFVFTKFASDTNGVLTNVRLSGAEFQLYKIENGTETLVKFEKVAATNQEGATFYKYYVDMNGSVDTLETQNTGDATITLDHLNMGGHLGDVFIFGLSEGKYKIVETKAPDGYVLPDAPFEIEITDAIGQLGSVGTLTVTGSHTGSGSIVNMNGMAESILTVWAEITNKPGSALPETGGMGTTLFTIFGVVLMAGALAFFTLRKRNKVVA